MVDGPPYSGFKDGTHLSPNQSVLIDINHSEQLQIDINIVTFGISKTRVTAIHGSKRLL